MLNDEEEHSSGAQCHALGPTGGKNSLLAHEFNVLMEAVRPPDLLRHAKRINDDLEWINMGRNRAHWCVLHGEIATDWDSREQLVMLQMAGSDSQAVLPRAAPSCSIRRKRPM